MYMRGITCCFRSIHDTPTPCGDRKHWPTWTTSRRRRGTGERWECPTTMHLLRVSGSESKSLAGTTVDEIIKIGRWKKEKAGNSASGRRRVHGSNRQRGNGTKPARPRASCYCLQRSSQFSPRARRRTPQLYILIVRSNFG